MGELNSIEELRACLEIQRAVWGGEDSDLMGPPQLRACQLAGGLVAGVYDGPQLVAFSSSLPAYRPGHPPGLHSDMTGVLQGHRGTGLGRTLKFFQRRWCLERGLGWVQWTFDPLRSANAKFNLEHLGAWGVEYVPDAYGPMSDGLNRGSPSDRLLVHWELRDERVTALANGAPPSSPPPTGHQAPAVLLEDQRGRPRVVGDTGAGSEETILALPSDAGALWSDPPRLRAWRDAYREVVPPLLENGYRIERFDAVGYLLRRHAAAPPGEDKALLRRM